MTRRPLFAVAAVIALSAAAASTRAFSEDDADAAQPAFSVPAWSVPIVVGASTVPAPQPVR